ncbi:MAG: GNAT family N-acetyltransferase [Lachnospiraceae bacterium]|nr:GNAT family N-acetyltransferase [Lachnospiraceae bacterium]
MNIQIIDRHHFGENGLDAFDRRQVVENTYVLKEGALELVHRPFIKDWPEERRRSRTEDIRSGKYITYGVIQEEMLVGFIMLVPELDHERMIVEYFAVSAHMRRQGIGRALFEKAKEEARERGAKALYISACPAEETIRFYRAMGCEVSTSPIQKYAEKEPLDIQMECKI